MNSQRLNSSLGFQYCDDSSAHRIEWIDMIKGIAILLVVMGHVIAQGFDQWHLILERPALSYLWTMIYSFHMPLFIFVSGFLSGRMSNRGLGDVAKYLWSKFLLLVVPYFFSGVALHFFLGKSISSYWYLATLFTLLCSFCVLDYLLQFVHGKMRLVVYLVGLLILYLAILGINHSFGNCSYVSYLFGHMERLYWYFAAGRLVRRVQVNFSESIKQFLYCVSIFLYIYIFTSSSRSANSSFLIGWPAIYIIWQVCKGLDLKKIGVLATSVCYLGRVSLEIYILHLFIPVKFPILENFSLYIVNNFGRIGAVSLVALQLVYSLLLSLVVIGLSILGIVFLKKSKFTYKLMLGRGW